MNTTYKAARLLNGMAVVWVTHRSSDDDGHSGWLSKGIAQYVLTLVAMNFDDTPNKIGLQWTVNTGGKASTDMPTLDQATFADEGMY
jgi:hypothetical protein